mmetsp:Transcript_78860/g.231442  ORF Transcript_78860/g.231442 Transcript_78860/m.231442 type:complete len:503 (+) Transcript_78860:463-1971(+)
MDVRDAQVLLELVQEDLHVPPGIFRIVEAAELVGHRQVHRGPQHTEVVGGVRGCEHQQDALAPAAHQLHERRAVLDAPVGDVEHAGRREAAEVEARGLLKPPYRRRVHQPAQAVEEGEEAEHDHGDRQPDGEQEQVAPSPAVGLAGAPEQLPAADEQRGGEDPERHGGRPVQLPEHLHDPLAPPPREAHQAGLDGRPEEDEVAPAQVQDLQPDAHADLVAHAEGQRIQAARTRERRGLREAAEGQRADVAALEAPDVQRAEGDLADAAPVRGAHEVVHRSSHDEKWAVGVGPQFIPGPVKPPVKEVRLQAPLVVPVPEAMHVVGQERHDQPGPAGPAHEFLPPRVVVVGDAREQVLPCHRAEDPELQQQEAHDEHRDGPEPQEDGRRQPGEAGHEDDGAHHHDQHGGAQPGDQGGRTVVLGCLQGSPQAPWPLVGDVAAEVRDPWPAPLQQHILAVLLSTGGCGVCAQIADAQRMPRRAAKVVLEHQVSQPLDVGDADHQRH